MDFLRKESYRINDLLAIMEILRKPEGCPWDREQTHKSIRRNFIEETYEAVEAIDTGDAALLKEELGDVLMQVTFHAQIEKESGGFDFDDVCDGVCKKLIFRHPHVFADVEAATSAEVLRNWDALKKREKNQNSLADVLRSVSRALPALIRAEKVQSKAAKAGFGPQNTDEALEAVRARTEGLEAAVRRGAGEELYAGIGDALYVAVDLARRLGIDPEESLNSASDII
ncbi:hypothetical protein FACS1894191_8940 [Clostridia bacterium]|nr:hypothetical protein FACS1894191_8940 [Clostridia bacterium]